MTPLIRRFAPVPLRQACGALALLLGASLLAGCGRPPAPPLRVGLNPWPGYEFLFLAQEKGYFAQEGVPVRLVELGSLADVRRAFERGQVDAVGCTLVEVLQIAEHAPARRPQVFLTVDCSEGADMILARPGIKTVAELKGRKVAVELASLNVYVLARALEKAGVKLSEVELVSLDQSAMERSFKNGMVDAVVTYPPFTVPLLRDHAAVKLFTSAEIPGEVVDVLAMDEAVLAARPREAAALVRAFHRAQDYARQNPAEAHALMGRREGISAAEFREALAGIRLLGPAEQGAYFAAGGMLAKGLATTDRVLRQTGQVTGADRTSGRINPSALPATVTKHP